LLDIDWGAWASVFAYPTEQARGRASEKLRNRMTSLSRELGHQVSAKHVADTLARAFENALDTHLYHGDLTAEELAQARWLAERKYGSASWTERI
jgi:lipoate-protein ligase A